MDHPGALIVIRPLDAAAAEAHGAELARLLIDAVEGGASIGFVRPPERAEAEMYWQGVIAAIRDGRRHLLAALADDRVIGGVQLELEVRANGRHRAEITKLMVLRGHRRQGVARRLMQATLDLARAEGRSLLLLDVRAGDPAVALYRALGFMKYGELPRYAQSPDGNFAATSFDYLERG